MLNGRRRARRRGWPRAISSSNVDAALGGERGEVLLHQRRGEAVDAGRHRRVGGEHAAGAHRLDRLGERQPGGHVLADPLEAEEAGVALVGVEHRRVDAERAQRPHAADAEHDLLAQAVLASPP